MFKKMKQFSLLFISFLFIFPVSAQQENFIDENQILRESLDLLKRYFYNDSSWYTTNAENAADVKSLINFIENEPLDSVRQGLLQTFENQYNFVFRLPENVDDSLRIQGYIPYSAMQERMAQKKAELQHYFTKENVKIPAALTDSIDEKLNLIPAGKGMQLFVSSAYKLPDHLLIPDIIPDEILNSPEKYEQLLKVDSLRLVYIEQKRIQYNDSITLAYIDSVQNKYITELYNKELNYQLKRISDSVKVVNYDVLRSYNEQVVNAVNDSIEIVLKTLIDYADFVDSTKVSIMNLSGDISSIWLKNGDERFARVWLKNVQNDSLGVMVRSLDKRTMYMIIDDGITFSRYKPKISKDFDFSQLEKKISSLTEIGKGYEIQTPWVIGGDGNIGFTQTYIGEYWKKGGQSAISSLLVLKGYANYSNSNGKIKWNNNAELRNGWIRFGEKDSETQKNDDKIELTSRFSVSAFKKWYYGIELNYETQLFKGYRYPRKDNPHPISAFMSPARTFFKIGMEYKRDKDFTLMLSPLTLKNVNVRDTALIDQTKFGIDADRKSFWEPGLNADLLWKYRITENIVWTNKYKMFINYQNPFSKFDINWENQIDVPVSKYINIRFMLHLIYDDDVLFPIFDDSDPPIKIGEKPRLQIKEFFSIGFTYKLEHKILKSKRLR